MQTLGSTTFSFDPRCQTKFSEYEMSQHRIQPPPAKHWELSQMGQKCGFIVEGDIHGKNFGLSIV